MMADDADLDGEEPATLAAKAGRMRRRPDVVPVRPGGKLRVLLVPDQAHVHRDQCEQDARQQQHVHDFVEPGDQLGPGTPHPKIGSLTQVPKSPGWTSRSRT